MIIFCVFGDDAMIVVAAWLVYPALTPAFKNRLAFKDNIEPAILTYIEDEDVSQPPTLA